MEANRAPTDGLIPLALLKQVEALAAAEHRPARDMVREAVERYVRERQALVARATEPPQPDVKLTPQEAGARILESRKRHPLPEGMTIRDMIDYGRA